MDRSIIEIRGYSCNTKGIDPLNLYYDYRGATYSNTSFYTNLYFFSDPTLEIDTAYTRMWGYFPSQMGEAVNGTAAFYDVLSSDTLNPVKNMSFAMRFEVTKGRKALAPLNIPKIEKFITQSWDSDLKGASVLALQNLTLNASDGFVYAVLVATDQIVPDPEDASTLLNISLGEKAQMVPSPLQIFRCQDANNKTAIRCSRCVFSLNTQCSMQFVNVPQKYVYKAYMVTANEFPIEAVLSKNVTNATFVVIGTGLTFTASLYVLVSILVTFMLALS
jgi:hypothetical protein